MTSISLPLDPLLQSAVTASDVDVAMPPAGDKASDSSSNIIPASGDAGTAAQSTHLLNIGMPLQTSLLQYALGITKDKKLGNISAQELNRFATALEPERQMMAFALNLKMRDGLNALVAANAASSIYSDLLKNIKNTTAAGFFSPEISYYTAPAGARRTKNIQNAIYDTLVMAGFSHLPVDGDQALKDKILQVIGQEFISHRSNVKDEIAKRAPGQPKANLSEFVAFVLRNAAIKTTYEHYGRFAFLSREYRSWSDRGKNPGLSAATLKLGYWEWVDESLKKVRKDTKKSLRGKDLALRDYFEKVIELDKGIFGKVSKKGKNPLEGAVWQTSVESAVGRLTAN